MWPWTQPPRGLVVPFPILKQFDFKLLFYIFLKKPQTWFPNQPFAFFFLSHIFSHSFSHMHTRLCSTFINKKTEKVIFSHIVI